MNRREYLAVTTTLVGSAGCATGPAPDSSSTDDTPTSTPNRSRRVSMGDTVTIDSKTATVADPRVSKSILTPGVHGATLESFDGQFVVADVSGSAQPTNADGGMLRPAIDGTVVDSRGPHGHPEPWPIADTEGAHAVPFPVRSLQTAAIAWSYGEQTVFWELPADTRTALGRQPVFSVEEFRLPRRDGRLVLTVTVANTGDRDGLFRMQVSSEGFSGHEIVQFPVPAGESREYTGRANGLVLRFENAGGGLFELVYPGERGHRALAREVSL